MSACDCLRVLLCFHKHHNGICIKIGIIFMLGFILCLSCYFVQTNRAKFNKNKSSDFENTEKLLQLKWSDETTTAAQLTCDDDGSGQEMDSTEVHITSAELEAFAALRPHDNIERIESVEMEEMVGKEKGEEEEEEEEVEEEKENEREKYSESSVESLETHADDLDESDDVMQRKRNCSNGDCNAGQPDKDFQENPDKSIDYGNIGEPPKKVFITLKADLATDLDSDERIFSDENSYDLDAYSSDEDLSKEFILTDHDNGAFMQIYSDEEPNERPIFQKRAGNRYTKFRTPVSGRSSNKHLSNFKNIPFLNDHQRLESAQPNPILTTKFEKITTDVPAQTATTPKTITMRVAAAPSVKTSQILKNNHHQHHHQQQHKQHHQNSIPIQSANFDNWLKSSNDYFYRMRHSLDKLFHKNNLKIKNLFEKPIKI